MRITEKPVRDSRNTATAPQGAGALSGPASRKLPAPPRDRKPARAALAVLPGYREPTPPPGGEAVPWLFTLARVPWTARARDALLARLARAGIESRPVFHALPALPPFRAAGFPVARRLAACGFSLPTYTALRSADVAVIARAVRSAWGGRPAAR